MCVARSALRIVVASVVGNQKETREVTTMPRIKEVPKDQAHPAAQAAYKMLFGDRDPVKEPVSL